LQAAFYTDTLTKEEYANTPFSAMCVEHLIKNKFAGAPVFWSGSSSFNTFLGVVFDEEKIEVEVWSSLGGGQRMSEVVDSWPTVEYPFHEEADLKLTVAV